jgi:uncharacterized protein YjdB
VNGKSTVTVTAIPLINVTATAGRTTMNVSEQQQLQLVATDSTNRQVDLATRTVTWSTSAPLVAEVTSTGIVSARGAGVAVISATVDGRRSNDISLTVRQVPVVDVVIEQANPQNIVQGTQVQLTAYPRDSVGNRLTGRIITWNSSNTSVATVTQTGIVTGVAPGSAIVRATVEGVSRPIDVIVRQSSVDRVDVQPPAWTMLVGDTKQLTVALTDINGNVLTGRQVVWTSGDVSRAQVDQTGRVTALAPGSVTITATSEGRTGQSVFTINAVPCASVSVAPTTVAIRVGERRTLVATARDAAGNILIGRTVFWQSSDPGRAFVNQSGEVLGVEVGSARISASCDGRSGEATVSVSSTVP